MAESARAAAGRLPGVSRRIQLGAVATLAVTLGLGAWALVSDRSNSAPLATTSASRTTGVGPVALSARGLGILSKTLRQPVYWAGTGHGHRFELTRTTRGNVYVRYLPDGVEAGAKGDYLIVVTYPFQDAYRAVKRVARGRAIKVRRSGIALVNGRYPKSVYVAFPGRDFQIEVYSPSPARSREIATSGDIRPVRR